MPRRLRSKAGMMGARGLDEGRAPTIAIRHGGHGLLDSRRPDCRASKVSTGRQSLKAPFLPLGQANTLAISCFRARSIDVRAWAGTSRWRQHWRASCRREGQPALSPWRRCASNKEAHGDHPETCALSRFAPVAAGFRHVLTSVGYCGRPSGDMGIAIASSAMGAEIRTRRST